MCATIDSIDRTLQRFLEVGDIPNVERTSTEDLECEEKYQSTTTRQPNGRYIVHLPFKQNPPVLGKSKDIALHRFHQLEIRFRKDPELHHEYNNAMQDYINTGHMSRLSIKSDSDENTYYIPHHAVLKPESATTQMRIVFDASSKTSTGYSLNDNLFCGSKLQQDLPGIILRFRLHPVVFTADIKQMFRQILVTEAHRPYQRLLYRFSFNEPGDEYQMNTVTFGQKSSPFLAIRTLNQLAKDEAINNPYVQSVIENDVYVDDVVTGAGCEEEAIKLQKSLSEVFAKGQFELRKWSSNSENLLNQLPLEHRQTQPVKFNECILKYTKVLGLYWDPKADFLSYKYQPKPV